MTAVAGLRGSGDFGADERPKDFRELIIWRNATGIAPVFALSGKANKEQVADPEFSWWDEPMHTVRLQVNNASGYTSTDTTIAVDSADPDANNPELLYGTAQHLRAGDLLLVEKSTETVTFDNEILMVASDPTSDTSITVTRGAAGTTAAAIPDNAYLLKIGSAFSEGTGAPTATSRNPVKYSNFCQIFKTAYELTNTTNAITNMRTGDPLRNDKKRKAWDHAAAIELAMLFGKKSETTGSNGKPLRTMAGLRSFIPASRTTVFTSAVTTSAFLDAVYPVFDYESEAGDERIVYCGNGFLNELNKIVEASGTVQFGSVVKTYGLNLREYILPQGRLFLRTHPIFNKHSQLNYSGFIVDPTAIRWRHLKGRDTHFKDNIQQNDEDLKKGQWLTEGGIEVWYGGLTMGYLGNLKSA